MRADRKEVFEHETQPFCKKEVIEKLEEVIRETHIKFFTGADNTSPHHFQVKRMARLVEVICGFLGCSFKEGICMIIYFIHKGDNPHLMEEILKQRDVEIHFPYFGG